MISSEYADSQAKIYLILYPPFENSTARIAIVTLAVFRFLCERVRIFFQQGCLLAHNKEQKEICVIKMCGCGRNNWLAVAITCAAHHKICAMSKQVWEKTPHTNILQLSIAESNMAPLTGCLTGKLTWYIIGATFFRRQTYSFFTTSYICSSSRIE